MMPRIPQKRPKTDASRALGVSVAVLAGVFAACGVDDFDLASKTCPCPAHLACDEVANRCVPPGTVTPATTSPECVPKACDELGIECGETNDGCGGLLDCGKCTLPNTACNADTHKCSCQPQNCAMQEAECGEVPSGCGEIFKCAGCPPDRPTCGGGGPNKCGTTPCVPKTCAGLGACGTVSDGCGKILDCGGCTAPQTCGGGGVANKCGCTVKTCAQVGWQCGTGPDNCGGTRTCPSCRGSYRTCDMNHDCVCTTTTPTCQQLGWECGSGPNGCGGTTTCAACPAGEECKDHECKDDD